MWIIGVIIVMWLLSCIKVLREYERVVIFRLGRVLGEPKGPGIIFVFLPFDHAEKVSLRTITLDVPPQDIITKDNVSVKVNAVIYYRIMEPIKAITEIEDFNFATSQISQTTLRSVVGQVPLDDLLSNREKLNTSLQEIIDKQTDPWGIKVSIVEIKHVDLPQEMQRAMARQAEAERERRAKVISA
ncbi:MAG: slipin family protein, partial [archaeon]